MTRDDSELLIHIFKNPEIYFISQKFRFKMIMSHRGRLVTQEPTSAL